MSQPSDVKRTAHAQAATVQNVRVDHRSAHTVSPACAGIGRIHHPFIVFIPESVELMGM